MLYVRHTQMRTVKTPFLKRCVCTDERARLRFSSVICTKKEVCYKSAWRSCLSFFWINPLIHFTDKQLCSNFILIHLHFHASKSTAGVKKEWDLQQCGEESFSNECLSAQSHIIVHINNTPGKGSCNVNPVDFFYFLLCDMIITRHKGRIKCKKCISDY